MSRAGSLDSSEQRPGARFHRLAKSPGGGKLLLLAVLAPALLAGSPRRPSGGRAPVFRPTRGHSVVPFNAAGEPSAATLVASGLTGAMVDTLVGVSGLRVMGRETTRWAQSDLSYSVLRNEYGLTHVLKATCWPTMDG